MKLKPMIQCRASSSCPIHFIALHLLEDILKFVKYSLKSLIKCVLRWLRKFMENGDWF